jgi:hypothetical protein
MAGSSLSQRKSMVRASLKRDIFPALHGMTPQPEGHMASHIRRRKFLARLGGAAVWPLAARAQHRVFQVIGCSAAVRLFWSTRSGVKREGTNDKW